MGGRRTSAHTIDMSGEGSLSDALGRMLSKQATSKERDDFATWFAWERLVPEYIPLYARVAAGSRLGRCRAAVKRKRSEAL